VSAAAPAPQPHVAPLSRIQPQVRFRARQEQAAGQTARTAPAAVRSLSKTTTAAINTITFGENDRRFPGTTTP